MAVFGSILRELRKSKSLTQTQLADGLGLAFSTISMYERGEREPDFETMETIADYFNVDMDFLCGRQLYPNKFQQNLIEAVKSFTPREVELVNAYRAQPSLQPAVDKLLGLSDAPPTPIAHLVRDAAFNGDIRISVATGSPEEAAEAKRKDDINADGF